MEEKNSPTLNGYDALFRMATNIVSFSDIFRFTKNIVTRKIVMKNPFKFGSIVTGDFFTDRVVETQYIERLLESENRLILISPRRYGKTSLIYRALQQSKRSFVAVNLQGVTSSADLSAALLKKILACHPFEKVKHLLATFRVVPTIKLDPVHNTIDVGFMPDADGAVALDEALRLADSLSTQKNRLVVVFDEFQTILELEKGLDRKMRSVMQELVNVNFILLGSQESMMADIFEKKKSPFYHFGNLLRLKRIPRDDFLVFIVDRLEPLVRKREDALGLANKILDFTQCHPYYTQQTAAEVWQALHFEGQKSLDDIFADSIAQILANHDLDYERLWTKFTLTERKILTTLARGGKVNAISGKPASTVYSATSQLVKTGYVIKEKEFFLEDPFFGLWIERTL